MSDKSPFILLVDDIPENLYIAESVLQDRGCRTRSATGGEEALRLAQEQEFDLVLLDILMPKMDGFEVCSRLKRAPQTRDLPVIFLTALTDDDNILRGFEAGGIDYVTKPFRPAELVARVMTHVALRRKELELRSLSASKDRFISIIADELRQPFAALRGVLAMVDSDYDRLSDSERRDYLKLSFHNADNLYRLIRGLTDWSQLQQGMMPFRPVAIDLEAAAADALAPFAEPLRRKQLGVTLEIPHNSHVVADREMLGRVLHHLLSNAIAYNVEKGGITLRAHSAERVWRVEVIDTGIGIEAAEQSDLFRLDQGRKRRGTQGESGTGMGLLLCKELVERQGGEISLTSSAGETCVAFTLPAFVA